MAERKPKMVNIDRNFVREEAAEAVRTFFRPVVGAYHLVRDASNPDKAPLPSHSASKRKGRS